MNTEQFNKIKQELATVLDQLFTKIVSGTSIQPKELDSYYAACGNLGKVIGKFSEAVALEKCSKINEGILKAFGKMEDHYDTIIEGLEARLKILEGNDTPEETQETNNDQ